MTTTEPRMIETIDPRTNRVTGRVPDMGPEEVAATVDAARAAFPVWSAMPFRERADHIAAVRDALLDRAEEIVDIICAETGKTEAEAVTTEVMASCELIEHYLHTGEKALRPERVSPGMMRHKRATKVYEPLGVVGVISPWNYPFTLTMTPVVSALFAGNTVVLSRPR
jgi:succinate-semialdehyde dehydrogenase/glutarate-semialdehyde dehydrogenase